MLMLTKQNRKDLPALYSQENDPYNAQVVVKYFTPWSDWTWYGWEFDGEDIFFGLVCGFEKEVGYFSLRELESVRGKFGLKIERDLHWTPITVRELYKKEGLQHLLP